MLTPLSTSTPASFSASALKKGIVKEGFLFFFWCAMVDVDGIRLERVRLESGVKGGDERGGADAGHARYFVDGEGLRDIFVRSFRIRSGILESDSITSSSSFGVFLRIDWLRIESSSDVPDFEGAEVMHEVDAFGLGVGVERVEDRREGVGDGLGEGSMFSEDEGEAQGVRLGEGRGNSWSSSSS